MIDIAQQTLFDYASLDADTRLFVQEKAQDIHSRLKRTAEDIIAIGQDLIEVKAKLPDMKFSAWIRAEFDMSRQTVYKFMRVAEMFKSCKLSLQLPVSVLYELAAPSTPDIVIEQVEAGQISPTIPAIRQAKQEVEASNLVTERDASLAGYKWEDKQWKLDKEEYTPPNATSQLLQGSQLVKSFDFAKHVDIEDSEDMQREIRREQLKERLAQLKEKGVALPTGKYSCLVVDPPWTMQKIEREERPNQFEFDYPTMDEEELKAFQLPEFAADDCHLYLWTTQKHLPLALRLAEHWGFRYQCLMTWVKNVGFTPFSWMYSTEHVLFCRKGNLPLLEMGRRLDFSGKVREHSRKPDEFYSLVKEVSPGPRLDVFSREKREGFDQYGNESEKFVSAR